MGRKHLKKLTKKVVEVFGVKDEKELFQKYTRNRYARSVFIEPCRKHLGAKISKAEFGRQIGNMSGAAINENRKRIFEVIKRIKKLKNCIRGLKKSLNRACPKI